jgi:hypothetical protein
LGYLAQEHIDVQELVADLNLVEAAAVEYNSEWVVDWGRRVNWLRLSSKGMWELSVGDYNTFLGKLPSSGSIRLPTPGTGPRSCGAWGLLLLRRAWMRMMIVFSNTPSRRRVPCLLWLLARLVASTPTLYYSLQPPVAASGFEYGSGQQELPEQQPAPVVLPFPRRADRSHVPTNKVRTTLH